MAVITLAVVVALGGLGVGYVNTFDEGDAQAVDTIDLRKDDNSAELVAEQDDDEGDGDDTRGDDATGGGNNTGDRDSTRGNDGTRGGDNTGDRDSTRGNDGTRGGDNTGDGDATGGNDGTSGGDNSYVAPAAPDYGAGDDSNSGGGYDT
jgi:hypothetical protein